MTRMLICIAVGSFLYGCTTRPVAPSRSSRRAIDTTYQQMVIQLQPSMDSICASLYDSLYTVAVDSIMMIRETEMKQLVK